MIVDLRHASPEIVHAALQFDLEILAWAVEDDPAGDYQFYERILVDKGGLALEVGCGAGRLMLAYLKRGLCVEGCDISAAMTSMCRLKGKARGLEPTVHIQAMQDLDLPTRYSTIYVPCGTFMCLTDLKEAARALRRFYDHLLPQGLIAISVLCPTYLDLIGTPLPSPWEPFYQLQLPPGFGEFTVHWRAIGFSVRDRVVAEQCRYRWKVDGRVDREEISDGQHRWHGKDEMVELLSAAGFAEIVVHGDYSDETFAESRHQSMAFVAVRP